MAKRPNINNNPSANLAAGKEAEPEGPDRWKPKEDVPPSMPEDHGRK